MVPRKTPQVFKNLSKRLTLQMPKYKEYFKKMMDENRDLFDNFGELHLKYMQDTKAHQEEFNQKGAEILDVIRKYENMLCAQSEGGGYGKYSANLADKFHDIIKLNFPRIDSIGLILPG